MPSKKELAGSADNGAPLKRGKSNKDSGVTGNSVIAGLIEQIEMILATDGFALEGAEEPDVAEDQPKLILYHASMSYVRGHQASSMEIFWRESRPAGFRPACYSAGPAGKRKRALRPSDAQRSFRFD